MLTFKKTKYLILLLLVLIGFIFNGELFIFHLDNFQASYYRTSFHFNEIPKDVSNKDVLKEFIDASKKNKVDFFIVDDHIKSAFYKETIIYATKGALEEINSMGIKDKKYESIFFGTVDVQIKNIEQLDNITKHVYFYLVGDDSKYQNMRNFKASLIDKYGGGFPKKYGSDRELYLNLVTIWTIILVFLFLMTLYEISYKKKETIVHIFLGTNLRSLFYKSIASDFGFTLLIFIIVPIVLSPFTNAYFKYSFVAILVLVAISINSFINALMLKIKFKKDIYSNASGIKFLKVNYLVKIIITFITIAVLSANFVSIKEGINYYKQYSFFENHKAYKYYRLEYEIDNNIGKTIEDTSAINQEFYMKFHDKSLMYFDLSENIHSNHPLLLINGNAFDEVKVLYPEVKMFKNSKIKNEITIFIPSNIKNDSLEYKNVLMNVETIFPINKNRLKDLIGTYRYKEDIELVGINNIAKQKSDVLNNPIIILDKTDPLKRIDRGMDLTYYTHSRMYDITQNEIDSFLKKYELTDQINIQSNVFEVYEHRLNIILRSMKLSIVLSILLLAIESSLIFFIILMEYRFNSKELALQKILGYSVLERNRKLILITLLSSMLSILIMFIILKLGGFKIGIHFIWIGIVLALIEILYLINRAIAIEKRRLTSILKGERV